LTFSIFAYEDYKTTFEGLSTIQGFDLGFYASRDGKTVGEGLFYWEKWDRENDDIGAVEYGFKAHFNKDEF